MRLNIGKEVVALRRLSTRELQAKYAELFGEQVWKTGNRVWLVKRIVWRLQALEEGDLSERARRRAAELANDADLQMAQVLRVSSGVGCHRRLSRQLPRTHTADADVA
jgi:hypothetical protein